MQAQDTPDAKEGTGLSSLRPSVSVGVLCWACSPASCPHPSFRLVPELEFIAYSGCPTSCGPYSGFAEGPPSYGPGNIP